MTRFLRSPLTAFLLAATALVGPAGTAGGSERARTLGGEVRLVVGGVTAGTIEAGLDIRLLPDWKTYWRYPGDSGIPTTADFAGSDNIVGAELRFPVPTRFPDGLGEAIGYDRPVLLPIAARLADPARPGRLKVVASLGVCREICVPVNIELEAVVDPERQNPRARAAIAAAAARVPVLVGAEAPLGIAELERANDAVEVTVRVPEGAGAVGLLVEGPAGWALPQPQPIGGSPLRFRFALDGLPEGADPAGARLRFTIITERQAVETDATLP